MPKSKPLPDKNYLNEIFDYDAETGQLRWRARRDVNNQALWNARYAGALAGHASKAGYLIVRLSGQNYKAHRIAWKIAYGEDPEFIDHLDGNRANNKLDNLRDVTQAQNNRNASIRKNSLAPYPGVEWHKRSRKFRAFIGRNGRYVSLGSFDTETEAVAARKAAEALEGFKRRGA